MYLFGSLAYKLPEVLGGEFWRQSSVPQLVGGTGVMKETYQQLYVNLIFASWS